MLMRNMLRRDANLWGKNTGKENDRPGKEKSEMMKKAERTGEKSPVKKIN